MVILFAILIRNSSQHNVTSSSLRARKKAPSIVLQKLTAAPDERTPFKTISTQIEDKVLISMHLSDDTPNLQAWKKSLTQNVPAVLSAGIKIESTFESRSSIILVTLPLEIWTVLGPTDETFTFIGFVRSSNRLGDEQEPQLPLRGCQGPQSQENAPLGHHRRKSLG
ncbi:hypothetical protein BJY00DRAFT_254281 [Aspergillus carlsbadensis]|nr:hypothetical protein BJY00DRAFT_254281 [Aspergillus carlsbadensis]